MSYPDITCVHLSSFCGCHRLCNADRHGLQLTVDLDLVAQVIAAESRAKLARLKEAWKEKAVLDKAVERGDVSKIKKKKVLRRDLRLRMFVPC